MWMAILVLALGFTAGAAAQTLPALAETQVTPPVSLAHLARQLRSERALLPPAPVYTNGSIPRQGLVSVPSRPAASASASASATARPAATSSPANAAAAWRKKFAAARQQLALDQRESDVTQRELNLGQQQYYSDPNRALRQDYSRSDLAAKKAHLEQLQGKVQADRARLDDLQRQLQQAGLPASWGRP